MGNYTISPQLAITLLNFALILFVVVSPPEPANCRAAYNYNEHFMRAAQEERPRVLKLGLTRLGGRPSYKELLADAAPAAAATYETPVFSASTAFLTTASIGTPPVAFNALVDTGSDLVWLQCQQCQLTCQSSTFTFDPSQSSSYQPASCSDPLCSPTAFSIPPECSSTTSTCLYDYTYGKGYTLGDFSYDTLTLPDDSGFPQSSSGFAFGCSHNNSNDFAGADGIMGLGRGPLSLPSQLGISQISYCFQSISDPASTTSPLFLGPAVIPPTSANGPTITTPLLTNLVQSFANAPFYYVKLNGINVGGELLSSIPVGTVDIRPDGSGGTFFDSGTTFTQLPSDAYNAVVDAFKSGIAAQPSSSMPAGLGLCYESSALSSITQLPSLAFHFDGADLEMPLANNYFDFEYEGVGLTCLAFKPSSSSVQGPPCIIGNIQQQNFYVLHDLQAQSLSLTPASCDSL